MQAKSGAAKHGYTESQKNGIKGKLPSPKTFRNTCSGTTSNTFNTPWLGRMHSKTKKLRFTHWKERLTNHQT
eukprot:4758864-Heterocapsa_arctica.AAC.1